MRWDDVFRAFARAAKADETLVGIHGADAIKVASGWTEQVVPGLQYHVISDQGNLELWEPCIVQADQWCETVSELALGERALRRLFDHDGPVTIEGVYCYSYFTDGAELGAALGPDRNNYFGRATRFRIVPIRESLQRGRSA